MPQDFVASAIVRLARSLPRYPSFDVLDLSCGRGEILRAVQKDGARSTRGTHYRGDDYKLAQPGPRYTDDLVIDEGIDLLQPLPYADSSFDLVILSEVTEHLLTEIPVLREVGRVLRDGGYLILSTPNVNRLHSRLQFFLTGTHKLIRRRVGWDVSPDELYAYHINPLDFTVVHTALFHAGLRVRELRFTRFKVEHSLLLLAYPLVWFFARIETRRRVTPGLHRQGEEDLLRWLVHPAMLASEQLLLLARKEQDTAEQPTVAG
jgi:SAM-dependent methyltransferase